MKAKIAVYNMEWMRDLFEEDGSLKTTGKDGKRSQQLAEIVRAMDPDFLGIAEGPNTLVNGSKTASIQLETWVQHFLPGSPLKGIHGFPSSGQQELCALYNSNKLTEVCNITLDPGALSLQGIIFHKLPWDSIWPTSAQFWDRFTINA